MQFVKLNFNSTILTFSLLLNITFSYLIFFSHILLSSNVHSRKNILIHNKNQLPITDWMSSVLVASNVNDCNNNTVQWHTVGMPGNSLGCHVKELLDWIGSLKNKERKIYSQQGEDGITEAIFEKLGHGNKFFVEFGVESGVQCNTRILRERHGWKGVMFDSLYKEDLTIGLHHESVWVESVTKLFEKYQIPYHIDYLSVDTDFADFWLVNEILKAGYKPRAIVIEINRNFDAYTSLTVPLSAAQNHETWKGTRWFGTSALALAKLLIKHGFYAVYIDRNAINMFFVHKSQLSSIDFTMAHWIATISSGTALGTPLHKKDNRAFVHICAEIPCANSKSEHVYLTRVSEFVFDGCNFQTIRRLNLTIEKKCNITLKYEDHAGDNLDSCNSYQRSSVGCGFKVFHRTQVKDKNNHNKVQTKNNPCNEDLAPETEIVICENNTPNCVPSGFGKVEVFKSSQDHPYSEVKRNDSST